MRRKQTNKLHQCPSCGKTFYTKSSLHQHEVDKHGLAGGVSKVAGPATTKRSGRRRRRVTRVDRMAQSGEGNGASSASFNPTGSAQLIPKGNPANFGNKLRPYFGLSSSYDSCHKFIKTCMDLGCTRDGAVFVLKNVHPNCDEVVEFSGIPDKSAGRVYPLEVRTINEFNSGETSKIWDFAAVSRWAPNISEVTYQKTSEGTDWSDPHTNRSALSSAALKDMLRYRVAYGGMTVYLSAAANQTEGMAYCGNRTPEIGFQVADASPSDKSARSYWREVAGKWDVAGLFSGDPGFYMNQSWEGVYGRMMSTGNAFSWVSTTDNRNTERNGWVMQDPNGVEKTVTDGKGAEDLFVPDIGSMKMPDISNVYVLLKGLDPKAKVIVKTRVGYEVIPKPGSLASSGMRYTPEHDEIAMEIAAELVKGLPSGVPASQNDLSEVLGSATDVLLDALSAAPNPWMRGAGMIGRVIRGLF